MEKKELTQEQITNISNAKKSLSLIEKVEEETGHEDEDMHNFKLLVKRIIDNDGIITEELKMLLILDQITFMEKARIRMQELCESENN